MRICELRQKEVINIRDCQRIGFVVDVEFDPCTGPVSYTHLDVYKRQAMSCFCQIFSGQRRM